MKILQVVGSKLKANTIILPSIVYNKDKDKFYVARLSPIDPKRGYFGKVYLEGLSGISTNENYVTVEKDEQIRIYHLIYANGSKKPTVSNQVLTV